MKYTFKVVILFITILNTQIYTGYSQTESEKRIFSFKSGEVQPEKGAINITDLQYGMYKNFYHVLVETNHLETIENLKSLGVLVNDYIPNNAYIMQVPANQMSKVLETSGVIGVYTMKPKWKLSAPLYSLFITPLDKHEDYKLKVEIVCFPGMIEDLNAFSIACNGMVKMIEPTLFGCNWKGETSIENISKLAELPFIQFISLQSQEPQPQNYYSRLTDKSNALYTDYAGGLKLNGNGIKVIISDSGMPGAHIDFKGRVDSSNLSNPYVGSHATQVAGPLASAGNLDPTTRGHAWGVDLSSYLGILGLHAFPNAYVNDSVTITSVSQGACCNGGYSSQAQIVDQNTINHDALLNVLGAGNDGSTNNNHPSGIGWGTISENYQSSKNSIVVGAVTNNDFPENYSSKGPLPDGRLKPEVVAVGHILTNFPGNQYIENFGTSLSCPAVSGAAAQLYQGYRELNNGVYPNSALVKALLMNTADDLGNPGPDFAMGYGRINVGKAYRAMANHTCFEGTLANGQSTQFSIQIPQGAAGLKVLLYWHDLPASVNTAHDLVNDLDLKVIDANGVEWDPWVLDPSNANANATRNEDHTNNSEQVTLSSVSAGQYIFNINAVDINMLGAQRFFVVYEVVMPTITVVHPQGGEAFAPGSDCNIRWEVEGIAAFANTVIEYSSNNGQTWNNIGTYNNYLSSQNWSIPWVTGGHYLIRATSAGLTDVSDAPFTVLKAPLNLAIDSVCDDMVKMSWDDTWTATGYEVFKLGAKYMEMVGSTSDNYFIFSGINTLEENWFSVRAIGPDDASSLRAIAIKQEPIFVNCIVGMTENNNKNIDVFPNPTNGFLYINAPNVGKSFAILTNGLGQHVATFDKLMPGLNEIDLSNLKSGYYYLRLDDQVFKVVKMAGDK